MYSLCGLSQLPYCGQKIRGTPRTSMHCDGIYMVEKLLLIYYKKLQCCWEWHRFLVGGVGVQLMLDQHIYSCSRRHCTYILHCTILHCLVQYTIVWYSVV